MQLAQQARGIDARVPGRVFLQFANGFAELAFASQSVAVHLVIATHGDMDDRLQEAAVGGAAVGPGDLNFFVRFEECAFVEKREPAKEAGTFRRGKWFVYRCRHAE